MTTLAIATASWSCLDRPILRHKARFAAACQLCGHRRHAGRYCNEERGREIGPGAPGEREEIILLCECVAEEAVEAVPVPARA